MGKEKAGFLTPKAIGNRIKAKGLQKLRWYCQMCQKQCRDENGFKCHCMSEAHQRQLLLFADNVDEYLDNFSKEFMESFVDLIKRRYGTRRINCNIVYNEFIADREHTHMNSTKWQTLTEFILYLGKEGMVAVDPTEKGIFITYIDRDPETLRRQEILLKREKFEALEAEKSERIMEEQVVRGQEQSKPLPEAVYTELKRDEASDEKIAFSLSAPSTASAAVSTSASAVPDGAAGRGGEVAEGPLTAAAAAASSAAASARPATATPVGAKPNPLEEAARQARLGKSSSSVSAGGGASGGGGGDARKRKSALEEIMEEEERRKRRRLMPPPPRGSALSPPSSEPAGRSGKAKPDGRDAPGAWLLKGIVVKVMDRRACDGDLYKAKCTVEEVTDRGRTALVRSPEGGALVPVRDADLETVIPAIGRSVLVLKGDYRGMEAILERIDVDAFSVNVTVVKKMKPLKRVPYEEVSKMVVRK